MTQPPLRDLLDAIQQVQSQYFEDVEPRVVFDALLESLLSLTKSEYGFIGDVHYTTAGEPYLLTQAITNIAWNEQTRRYYDESAETGIEFSKLKSLFGVVMTSGQAVIANDPAHDARRGGLPPGHPPLEAFLGLPLYTGSRMVGMLGIANRANGYDDALVEYLAPLTATCAGIILAYRNGREREAEEARRRASEEQMQQMQRLESLGLLVGGIAHDFNNLLSGIVGNVELALLDVHPEDPMRELLGDVQLSATRAAELTHQLLVYTGKSVASVDTFDLGVVVAEMSSLSRSVVPHSATLEIAAPAKPVWVRANATQLRQLVMNLIANASDSLADGAGHIAVTTGRTTIDPHSLGERFVLGRPESMEYASIEVRDNGCGMAREAIERIFDPFYSSKGPGRGLGLTIAIGIVKNHDALLVVESDVGRGSTFKVLFPLAGAPTPTRPGAPEPTDEPGEVPDTTVLVVDDEPAVARVTTRMAQKMGYRVLTVSGGAGAIEIVQDDPQGVSVVVLDATMPEMSGEATFYALREIRPDLPVLFVSGYGSEALGRLIGSKSGVRFLSKPVSMKSLGEQLELLLDE